MHVTKFFLISAKRLLREEGLSSLPLRPYQIITTP